MDDQPMSPVAVKADDQSSSVLFTYFQGDINSVVDEHFSRALNKANRPKDLTSKSKGSRQTPRSDDLIPVQWGFPASSWSEPPYPSTSSGQIHFSMLEDAHTSQRVMTSPSNLWSFAPRAAAGFGMPSVVYPSPGPAEAPGPSERPYANSFLGLLHSDRPVAAASLSSPSKPDLAPGWNPTAGFRDPLESGTNLDSDVYMKLHETPPHQKAPTMPSGPSHLEHSPVTAMLIPRGGVGVSYLREPSHPQTGPRSRSSMWKNLFPKPAGRPPRVNSKAGRRRPSGFLSTLRDRVCRNMGEEALAPRLPPSRRDDARDRGSLKRKNILKDPNDVITHSI